MEKIQDSDGNSPGFVGVFIPREIFEDENLTATEVLLYGTVAAFGGRGCYMLAEDIEKRIKCGAATRRKAVEKLEKLGYIMTQKQRNGRLFMRSTLGFQKSQQPVRPEEIEERPDEEAEAEPRDPKKYGAEDINDYLETWKEETGFDFLEDKQQRKCARLVLNKYGMDEAVKIARRVGRAQTDRYAPRITSPNDIVGRYSKLPALEVYEKRRDAEQNQPKSTAPKPSKLAQMHYTAPDFRWADYTAENNESDETKAAAIKKARQIFEARSHQKPATKPEAKK